MVGALLRRRGLTQSPPPAPQLKGVRWMISLYQNGLNGILADQMVRVQPQPRRQMRLTFASALTL